MYVNYKLLQPHYILMLLLLVFDSFYPPFPYRVYFPPLHSALDSVSSVNTSWWNKGLTTPIFGSPQPRVRERENKIR